MSELKRYAFNDTYSGPHKNGDYVKAKDALALEAQLAEANGLLDEIAVQLGFVLGHLDYDPEWNVVGNILSRRSKEQATLPSETCEMCEGKGEIYGIGCTFGNGCRPMAIPCPACNGTGKEGSDA